MESRIKYNNIRSSGNQVTERPVLSCTFNLGIMNHLLWPCVTFRERSGLFPFGLRLGFRAILQRILNKTSGHVTFPQIILHLPHLPYIHALFWNSKTTEKKHRTIFLYPSRALCHWRKTHCPAAWGEEYGGRATRFFKRYCLFWALLSWWPRAGFFFFERKHDGFPMMNFLFTI